MNVQRIMKASKLLVLFIITLIISSAAVFSPAVRSQAATETITPEKALATKVISSATPEAEQPALSPTLSDDPDDTPTPFPPTPTPFPDWAMTSKDTDGLLFAGIFILFIIIIGTITAMAQKPQPPKK